MKRFIEKILIEQEGYTEHVAKITATDLLNIKDLSVKRAVNKWCENGEKENICKDMFSCFSLMKNYGMKYPATLIFLDWYSESPDEAINSLLN